MSELKFRNKTLQNARDLGGIPVAGGKVVKSNKLLRSNALADAKHSEVAKLERFYDLGLVIDLRSEGEVKSKQDPMYLLPTVLYVNIPLTQGNAVGIVRKGGLAETIAMGKMIENDPAKMMQDMYVNIVTSAHGQQALAMIFGLLLSQSDTCILWHCTAGKDRAGIVAAMILLALGASRDDVLEDYVTTNYFMSHYEKIQKRELMLTPKKVKDNIYIVNEADPSYLKGALDAIDEQYGGIDAYLKNQIGLSDAHLEELRALYTE